MTVNFLTALSLFAVLATGGAAVEQSPADDAQGWMTLIDHGDYDQSWAAAGSLFKANITQRAWAYQVRTLRQPLGAIGSRKLKAEQHTDTLPGAPDGHYEVLQFDSQFANKGSAVETVILAQEPTGWRVDGYFIR